MGIFLFDQKMASLLKQFTNMKKLLILASLACVCIIGFGQAKKVIPTHLTPVDSLKMKTTAKAPDKYHDNVDDRMKGPKGEKIYIGPNGGRYYLSSTGKKVYVPYAGNKKPVAKP